jgi:hypothetical protein
VSQDPGARDASAAGQRQQGQPTDHPSLASREQAVAGEMEWVATEPGIEAVQHLLSQVSDLRGDAAADDPPVADALKIVDAVLRALLDSGRGMTPAADAVLRTASALLRHRAAGGEPQLPQSRFHNAVDRWVDEEARSGRTVPVAVLHHIRSGAAAVDAGAPADVPQGEATLQQGIAAIRRLEDSPLLAPRAVPAMDVVPVESLQYRGRPALERAIQLRNELRDELRDQLRQQSHDRVHQDPGHPGHPGHPAAVAAVATLAADDARVEELFALLDLALTD